MRFLVSLLPFVEAFPAYHELWFQQEVDHFDESSSVQWAHRYLLNNASWDGRGSLSNGCRGPILVYAGNEGAIEGFWESNGWMIEVLAPKFGALLLFPEQRFYGQSQPFGSKPTAEARKLQATRQVVADYAALLEGIRASVPGAAGCPAVAFGGSYGGTLAALFRAWYPEVISGAHAASSELGYYDHAEWAKHGVDEYTWETTALSGYRQAHPQCVAAISAARDSVDSMEPHDVGLAERFHACDLKAMGSPRSDFFAYAIENLAQLNYPYSVGGLPANPVDYVCRMLIAANDIDSPPVKRTEKLLAAAVNITVLVLGPNEDLGYGGCISDNFGGPSNIPGDGPGDSSWGYQSCQETIHPFSSQVIRKYAFNLNKSTSFCRKLWNDTVVPNTTALAGAYALATGISGVKRIIWTHGTLDPWGGWFKVPQPPGYTEIYHFMMEGGAHHLDLRGPNPADPPAVTAARAMAETIIGSWLKVDNVLVTIV